MEGHRTKAIHGLRKACGSEAHPSCCCSPWVFLLLSPNLSAPMIDFANRVVKRLSEVPDTLTPPLNIQPLLFDLHQDAHCLCLSVLAGVDLQLILAPLEARRITSCLNLRINTLQLPSTRVLCRRAPKESHLGGVWPDEPCHTGAQRGAPPTRTGHGRAVQSCTGATSRGRGQPPQHQLPLNGSDGQRRSGEAAQLPPPATPGAAQASRPSARGPGAQGPCSRRRWGGESCLVALVEGGDYRLFQALRELPPRPSCRASSEPTHPASPCNQLAQRHLRQLEQQPQASGLRDGGGGLTWPESVRLYSGWVGLHSCGCRANHGTQDDTSHQHTHSRRSPVMTSCTISSAYNILP
ncbi:hypothetical protein N1851_007070 [Merluccius polli]|uniref:Uncharacterized protein n=1 Tax=Merluccius polli TaxID=89951 RepID=A0AA47N4D9_MERPO|nr:hypothetical protein N1851_007070 [Merluccius polli]